MGSPRFRSRFLTTNTAGTPGGSSSGNLVTIFVDGQASYDEVLADIRRARERVWLEIYILERDEAGREFVGELTAAARRGCDVRLLFDRFGSPRIGVEQTRPLVEAGAMVAVYNPLVRRHYGRKISSFLHRDHRKILVADDVGYTGGRNIGLEYGTREDPGTFFDLTVRIQGPAIRDLASVFSDAFRDATGQDTPLPQAPPSHASGIPVDVLELDQKKSHHDLDLALRSAIRASRSSILLMTPYFVPPKWFLREVYDAAARGVDVKLLTAGRSDVPFIRVAGRHLYGRLLKRGIRVFEMQHPILHAKSITIDGAYSIVGSYNIDSYGGAFNLEVGVGLHDEGASAVLTRIFHEALADSSEVTLGEWLDRGPVQRFTQWAAYKIARVP